MAVPRLSSVWSLTLGQRLAQVTEVAGLVGLDLVPRQDDALPTDVDVGHDGRVAEAFGDAEAGVGHGANVRRRGVRGHHGAGGGRQREETDDEAIWAHKGPFLIRASRTRPNGATRDTAPRSERVQGFPGAGYKHSAN